MTARERKIQTKQQDTVGKVIKSKGKRIEPERI